ncbi:polysaccharide deacetylase family protein [Nitrosovibrio tenuis]|uniref:Peptidoglycan/xylan/chitin deacetylase, PgdA/CDA1 family n=1 Tax=Nitrosovibrio tenuis TaxID=1233 RepID=A0A1H7FRB8_9PROT|nr:polysaccharide deacetylase family protein [Nitrosovibrio tenuis]SEK28528.1 Peptidoglycan/xylan/chitin deacetylase, PgdA/CDA1 family [Nitrosovibrio tenuis]
MAAHESGYVEGPSRTIRPWTSLPSRTLLSLLSPGGRDSRLSILIYHRVLPHPDTLFPDESDAVNFDQQMKQLVACFNVIPLIDAVQGLNRGKLPSRAACITFDDGYADNAEIALPILQKHGLHATFFVASSFLDGGRMWNDTVIELVRRAPGPELDLSSVGLGQFQIGSIPQRRQAIHYLLGELKYMGLESRKAKVEAMCTLVPVLPPRNLMMTSDQVRVLHRAGMEIGGHTANHPILSGMENNTARAEIAQGKEMLEGITRAPVRLFAYPNGKPGRDYLSDHVRILKGLGFDGAVSTAYGVAKKDCDVFQLPRFTPWGRGLARFTLQMARNMLATPEIV